jgi:hypothetical protein
MGFVRYFSLSRLVKIARVALGYPLLVVSNISQTTIARRLRFLPIGLAKNCAQTHHFL